MEKKTTYHMGGKPYYGIPPTKKASSAESKKSIAKDKSVSQNISKKDTYLDFHLSGRYN